MLDEIRELYKAYFMKLYMWQSGDVITVCWSRREMPGYSTILKEVNHKTTLTIKKYEGIIMFSSSTSYGRDLW